MNQNEMHEARTNPEFLSYLKEKEEEVIKSKSISGLYEVLDTLLVLDLDENRINRVYEEILKCAFEQIEERLQEEKKLTLKNDDIYFIRSFYEHAIEKWSVENYQGAKELFFILTQIVEDEKLCDAIMIHLIACVNETDMESFYDNEVNTQEEIQTEDEYGYFIHNFQFDTKEYLQRHSNIIEEQYQNLKHLLNR